MTEPIAIEVLDLNSPEVYYHSLYHHIAHWGAFVAMMGVQLTLGFFISLTPIKDASLWSVRAGAVAAIIVASALGALYFIKGMYTYGRQVNTRVGSVYYDDIKTVNHSTMIFVECLAAVVAAGFNLFLLVWTTPH